MQSTPTIEKEKGEELSSEVVHFRDDFYRDGFRIILLSLGMVIAAIGLLIVVSLYFFFHQVLPITFHVHEDFRVQADIPVDRSYLHLPDLLQWVSLTLPQVLTLDFINYDLELKNATPYFTSNGWAKFLALTNTYMNHEDILKNKAFVQALPSGAPTVLNQGIVEGKYAWWVQMPLDVRYSGMEGESHNTRLLIQALIVRVPTLNNLEGVAIDNLIVNQG